VDDDAPAPPRPIASARLAVLVGAAGGLLAWFLATAPAAREEPASPRGPARERWEIRSAGPDGRMGTADDVVITAEPSE
jgi:hypothetical protein